MTMIGTHKESCCDAMRSKYIPNQSPNVLIGWRDLHVRQAAKIRYEAPTLRLETDSSGYRRDGEVRLRWRHAVAKGW